MSISLMTAIWRTCLFSGNTLNLLLAMADFANDDGGDVFPGIELLATKPRASVRTTQICLRELERSGVIEQVVRSAGGRGRVTEYRIDLETVQKLQGLHEAENPDCRWCEARRRSAEKRAQFRAQRVQAAAEKGAGKNVKGADSRSPIEDNLLHPPHNHQDSLAPDGASESGNVAMLGKGCPERFGEFRTGVAATWPGGFPADNEPACLGEFERITRQHDASLLIECARLHGAVLQKRQDARHKSAGALLVKRPSNFLKDGEWQGYVAEVERQRQAESETASAIGRVRRALGDEAVNRLLQEEIFHHTSLAALDGVILEPGPPPVLLVPGAAARAMIENRFSQMRMVFGEGLTVMRSAISKSA